MRCGWFVWQGRWGVLVVFHVQLLCLFVDLEWVLLFVHFCGCCAGCLGHSCSLQCFIKVLLVILAHIYVCFFF